MQKCLKLIIATLALTPLSIAQPVTAADYPKKIFLATFETESPKGKGEGSFGSNGKGIVRMSSKDADTSFRYFIDYNSDLYTTIMDSTKSATTKKLDEAQKTASLSFMDSYKKIATKDLGSKVIDGHPCHGYKFKDSSTSESGEAWIAEDYNVIVRSETTNRVGYLTKSKLKKIDTNPPESEFNTTIPADYKVVELK
ncbi:MAG: DUF4412 domain-containing protein [Candidatus Melainabacteria bacterium]|nr:DUF4412 domain-containing protein [Candidatus Melainabacteria bacterium]